MDSSKKPEKKSPRQNANPISQLLFMWIIPLLFRGSNRGLNASDDLSKCLPADESERLGDNLERQWERELRNSKLKKREPKLRRALLKTFITSTIVDGFLIFFFVLIKSLTPLILAQLLIQFQQPTAIETLLKQNNSIVFNETLQINEDFFNRTKRDINTNYNNINSISDNDDIVKKVPDEVYPEYPDNFLNYLWNDVYWLSSGLVLMTLITCFISHHADLRQRMVGARMRISCCSLIYRKTIRLSKKAAGQTPAGYLVNLLSNDVSRLDYGLIYAHYVWILPLQSALICYLIWRKVGIVAIIGVVSLLVKTIPVQTKLSQLSSKIRMKVAQRTDKRVGIMNEIIRGIQVIKMYAWEVPFEKIVAEARKKEVKQIRYASYIRGIFLSTMVFTERSTLFIAIMGCVFLSKPITADVVFSMAQYFNILQLTAAIFYPLALSLGAEALVSIKRVEEYLLMEEQEDTNSRLIKNENTEVDKSTVILKNVSGSWSGNKKEKTLDSIDLNVKPGQLCAVIGPVGAGKSSLLQLLLGEIPITDGEVRINGTISYASQEPWLFPGTVRNNILFGLDYNKKLYQEVIKHCALLTDFIQLPAGDKTIIGERGTSLSGGQKARISLARAVYKNVSIYLFDDPLSAVDTHVGRHLFDEVIGPKGYLAGKGRLRILVTHQVHYLKEADWIVIIENGKISKQGTYKELSNSNLDFAKLLEHHPEEDENIVENFIDDVVPQDDEDIPYIDGYVGVHKSSSDIHKRTVSISSSNEELEELKGEDQAEGKMSVRVWKKYFLAGGGVCFLIFFCFILALSQIIISGSDYFVNFWTQQEFLRNNNLYTILTTEECLIIYGIFIIAVVFMTIIRGWMFFNLCMRASKNLHNRMFASLLRTSMRFFDTNPSGRILNRFSRDMGAIDELLPKAIMDSIQVYLVMIGILAMVSIVNPVLLLALVGAVILFALVLKLYIRPAQDLKRLEGICKSPVFSHLSASLSGLSTIRACNAQDRVMVEFDNLQDVHSSVWHLTISSNNALGLWLDCISTAFVATVTFSFVALQDSTFSGNVGLTISQALILTGMVQYGVRMSAESMQQMTSVERVQQYTDLPPEKNPPKIPPSDWPKEGRVQFVDMSLYYDTTDAPVLKNLNIDISPGWKVGIVGRTGAGKSSLINALFRLCPIKGSIFIDGLETGMIHLEELRKNISIIPQDPVLFSESLRYNLDPFNSFADDDLYKVLGEVDLKSNTEGLDYMVTEAGSNFSVGQRQLICLARAILRKCKILVLDEATANVDPKTDELIQKTIREKFKNCTVLTIAHRLHTVMDSDRILVMEGGYAKEFDIPHNLLQERNGLLRSIVDATGPQESEALKRIASDKYQSL